MQQAPFKVNFDELGSKNIDYNRMELRKIWHDGRFSVRASESSSVVQAAELLIGQIGPRS